MKKLEKIRHILAPLAGAVVVVFTIFAVDLTILGAAVAGGISWAGTAYALKPGKPSARAADDIDS